MNEEANNVKKENLENKIGFWDRAKYFGGPALITVGAYFGPEIKRKYDTLPKETKDKYCTVALASTTLLGTFLAVVSGYKLVKDYAERTEGQKETIKNTKDLNTIMTEVL